jgi:hypothetical protein
MGRCIILEKTLLVALLLVPYCTSIDISNPDPGEPHESCSPPLIDASPPLRNASPPLRELPGLGEDQIFAAWKGQRIDHVPLSAMTHHRFRDEYMGPKRPVVITGAYADSPLVTDEWNWIALRDNFGHVMLDNRIERPADRAKQKNCTTLGLCQGEPIRLADLVNDFIRADAEPDFFADLVNDFIRKDDTKQPNTTPYPHDLLLEKTLPEMYNVYRQLTFFAENILLSSKDGHDDQWPSLFLGARGTQTRLHQDIMGTSFTMAVFRGRKQFVLFHPRDGPKLCMEHPLPHLDYGVEAFNPNFRSCPTARSVTALFADVAAGDILYVPGSYHHAARNIQDSIAVSQNFLTVSDYASVMESHTGYVKQLKRQQQTEKLNTVVFDFLAIRSFFHLLHKTEYRSNWIDVPLFLPAKDAQEEAFARLVFHLKTVLRKEPSLASDLGFMTCDTFHIMALKVSGLWECIQEQARERIFLDEGREKQDGLERLEAAFVFAESAQCKKMLSSYLDHIMKTINQSASTMHLEKGMTFTKPV